MTTETIIFLLMADQNEHNGYCDSSWKMHRNIKLAFSSVNVNNIWQGSGSHSNQNNLITLHSKKEWTDFRVLRIDSGANQVHSTSEHGNPYYDLNRTTGKILRPNETTATGHIKT